MLDADDLPHDPGRNHAGEWCQVTVCAMDYYEVIFRGSVAFEIHTLVSGNWEVTQATTDTNGVACGLVECGSPFRIASLSSDFTIGNHNLPSDFVYEDDIDTDEVVGIATSYEEITDDRGPVHKYETETCEQIEYIRKVYHHYFVFRDKNIEH